MVLNEDHGSLVPQRLRGSNAGGATDWYVARDEADNGKQQARTDEDDRVGLRDAESSPGQQLPGPEPESKADRRTDNDESHTLTQHETNDFAPRGTQRKTDPDFTRALMELGYADTMARHSEVAAFLRL